jgi:hypothetical protein
MSEKESQGQLAERIRVAKTKVQLGARYVHYKQLSYRVLDVAIYEADGEPCVIYQAEYGKHVTWIRPITSWLETVEVEGKMVPRFTKIEG